MRPRSPQHAFDGYQLIRLLGKGGMGEVHLAHDTLLDRPVAIKFISSGEVDEETRRRFMVEARAIARLQHPNVVSIYRVGEVDGYPYLVSEFIRGTPLDEIEKPAPYAQVLKIATDIACGLAAAHRQGVVHRDIKPANAIITDEGDVKLLDFGIAKLVTSRTSLGAMLLERPERSPRARPSSDPQLSDPPPTPAQLSESPPTAVQLPKTDASVSGAAKMELIAVNENQDELTVRHVPSRPPPATLQGSLTAPLLPRASDATELGDVLPGKTTRAASNPRLEAALAEGDTDATAFYLESEGLLTLPGIALGTPRYMAPEVWRGEPANFSSDIYSFGALIYHLASGRPPHKSKRLPDLGQLVVNVDAAPLATLAPEVEPAFSAIIDRCLARSPELRYASGSELRTALADLCASARDKDVPAGNPYRGLHAFEAEHQNLFFGRDSEIRMIGERLGVEAFILVAGDSGVGKSSLCRAGVLPRLSEWLDRRRSWTSVMVVPGRHPLTSFSAALAPLIGGSEQELAREISADPAGFGRRLRATGDGQTGIALFVDQLEELVTLSEPTESAAVSELLGWLAAPAPGVRLLATVRGDFLSRLAILPHIGNEISRALYFLRPLSEERLHEVIVGPAKVKGVAFEPPELVDELVASTVRAGGGLPLLQFALAELWEAKGTESVISRAALEALGGVAGALSRHADNVLAGMLQAQREAARQILRALVTTAGTRARLTEEELGANRPGIRAALDALVRGRLVVGRDTPEGAGYEVAHEALISTWSTLAAWLSEDAEVRRVQERLRSAVTDWERLGRPRELLWSARQLAESHAIERTSLAPREQAFLEAGRRAHLRSRLGRVALWLAVPLFAASIYSAVTWKNRVELTRRVESELSAATAALDDARAQAKAASTARQLAFSEFDRAKPEAGEVAWRHYLERIAAVEPSYSHAGQHLETALLMDQAQSRVRGLLADVLYERAEIAEGLHRTAETEELLQRLSLYDVGGMRLARWKAPAKVAISAAPAASVIRLERYTLTADRRYTTAEIACPQGMRDLTLAPGSYVATVSLAGYAEVRYPFVLRRGARKQLDLRLRPASEVPEGFIHVPAGSFLYGSAAEDGQRRDFFHAVPLHEVAIEEYLVARLETTFADWMAYVAAQPQAERQQRLPRIDKGGFSGALALEEQSDGLYRISFQPMDDVLSAVAGEPIVYPGRSTRARQDWLKLPVVGITAAEAEQYAAWAHTSGRIAGARLCTEQEWEHAARGADGREYPHGEALRPDDANYDDTYKKDPRAMGPDEVGTHPTSTSPVGTLDQAGNVWEWARSSLAEGAHTARGGSWAFGANSSRVTDRELTEPSFRDSSVGFRLCADLPR